MSEQNLHRFLKKLNEDTAFRDQMKQNWQQAIEEFDLSPAEISAILSNDADALRRLLNADVSGFAAAGWWGTIGCTGVCGTAGNPRNCPTWCPSTQPNGGCPQTAQCTIGCVVQGR